jgi:hypothetical protein
VGLFRVRLRPDATSFGARAVGTLEILNRIDDLPECPEGESVEFSLDFDPSMGTEPRLIVDSPDATPPPDATGIASGGFRREFGPIHWRCLANENDLDRQVVHRDRWESRLHENDRVE